MVLLCFEFPKRNNPLPWNCLLAPCTPEALFIQKCMNLTLHIQLYKNCHIYLKWNPFGVMGNSPSVLERPLLLPKVSQKSRKYSWYLQNGWKHFSLQSIIGGKSSCSKLTKSLCQTACKTLLRLSILIYKVQPSRVLHATIHLWCSATTVKLSQRARCRSSLPKGKQT